MRVLAQTVSGVLHPLCIPLLTLGLLMFTDGYLVHRLGLFAYLFVLLLINTLAPAISLWLLKRRGVISDLDIRKRSERPWPFLLVLAYYLMAYVLVVQSTAVAVPVFYQQVLLSLVVAIASAWVVTWKAKISMHMLAQGGILAVYLHVAMMDHTWDLNWVSVLLLSAGLVGWSRLRLGAHTPAEVYSGFALGLLTVWITLF
ncbi:phosphatase PAP2 family protein [Flavobacteriales bacterium]|nr:phosphatase PAP2 family protein [Flavobacteriales bacterium]MEC8335552.1 phosphatase PAP2 family protein [Bacteroidota bacterium]MEC8662767.1 phosphatase PAP2 family protein [Bacteroidota bacterium]